MLNVNMFKELDVKSSGVSYAAANSMVSTKESRKRCIELLSYDERKMLLQFIKSVDGRG